MNTPNKPKNTKPLLALEGMYLSMESDSSVTFQRFDLQIPFGPIDMLLGPTYEYPADCWMLL